MGSRRNFTIFSQLKQARLYLSGEGLGSFLIRSVAGTGAVRVGSVAASFLVGVQLARGLGVQGYGYYGIAMSAITLAGVPGEMGLSRLVTREVAAARALKDLPRLFGILRWADKMAWRVSVAMAAMLVIAAVVLLQIHRPEVSKALLIGSPIVPLMALSRVRGGALQGLQQVVRGQIPANLFRPALFSLLLLAAALAGLRLGAATAIGLSAIAALVAFLVADRWLRGRLPIERSAEIVHGGVGWLASCVPMALTDGMRVLQSELSILLLGLLASVADVGLFRVATATAAAAAAGLVIVVHATMPSIAHLHATGEHGRLQRLVTYSAWLQLAGVLVFAVPLLLFPGFLLSFAFGAGFVPAATPLRIIALGQIANAAFGPNVLLLNMAHQERRVARAMGIALLINVIGLLVLGSLWGATGAAAGFAMAMICWNVLAWLDARRFLRIETSVLSTILLPLPKIHSGH